MSSRVNKLSPMQIQCLRLVFEQMSSKDIAKELDASPHTVDNHIKKAISRLGATNRREASRMLAEAEGMITRRALASQSPVLGEPAIPEAPLAAPAEEASVEGSESSVGNSAISGQTGQSIVGPESAWRFPLPRYWGEENTLPGPQRAFWALLLAIATCVGVGAVVATIEALQRIV